MLVSTQETRSFREGVKKMKAVAFFVGLVLLGVALVVLMPVGVSVATAGVFSALWSWDVLVSVVLGLVGSALVVPALS